MRTERPTPTAEQVAKELVRNCRLKHQKEPRTGYVEGFACPDCITTALRSYAAQQVAQARQETWEAAAEKAAEYLGNGSTLEAEFGRRSRAQGGT